MLIITRLTTIVKALDAYCNETSPLFIPGSLPRYFSLITVFTLAAPNLMSSKKTSGNDIAGSYLVLTLLFAFSISLSNVSLFFNVLL